MRVQMLLALAQGEMEEGGGPRPHRLSLLLRAQILLHRRDLDVVGEFTYPAYDTLLALLHNALEEKGLEHEHVPLAMELVWLTLNACGDNAPFLGDRGAVPVFARLLARCASCVPGLFLLASCALAVLYRACQQEKRAHSARVGAGRLTLNMSGDDAPLRGARSTRPLMYGCTQSLLACLWRAVRLSCSVRDCGGPVPRRICGEWLHT
jgi:hypothetical protein